VTDSVGVEIVTSPMVALTRQLGWMIDEEPDLVVSEWRDAAGQRHPFRRVGHAQFAGDTLVVHDRTMHALRRFRGDGTPITATLNTTVDSPGRESPIRVIPGGDPETVYVFDFRGHQILLIDIPSGTVASFPVRSLGWGQALLHVHGSVGSRLVVSWQPALEALEQVMSGGLNAPEVSTGLIDWESGTIQVIASGPHGEFWSAGSGSFLMSNIPSGLTSAIGVGMDHTYIASSHESDIRVFRVGGEHVRTLRMEGMPLRLTPAEKDLLVEEAIRLSPMLASGRDQWSPRVEVWPLVDRFLVDAEGWLWAKMPGFGEEGAARWVVFDPDGRAKGWVSTPPPEEFQIHSVGQGLVVGTSRGPDGAERVEVRRLNR
jgi:hypothetical protein